MTDRNPIWARGLLLATMLLLLMLQAAVQAREPAVSPEEMVAVELATVGLDATGGSPVVVLREPRSGDVVLISIGNSEAFAILLALQEVPVPRPMTHDLLANVIRSVGGTLERVMVDALVGTTYTGVLELRIDDRDERLYVDSRPSDALALAVRTGATILVAPDVLVATRGREFEALPDQPVVTALGITVGTVNDDLREAFDLPELPGLLVSRVVGTAAGQGLAPGALILEVNGEVPASPVDFLELVRRTPPDADAVLRFWQEGEIREIELSTDVPDPHPLGDPARPRSGLQV